MREDTRNFLEDRLIVIDNKMINKKDNVRGGLYIFGVGILGALNGTISGSFNAYISGMIVATGGILFRAINKRALEKLSWEKYSIKYALRYDNVIEYHSSNKGGKHFKK